MQFSKTLQGSKSAIVSIKSTLLLFLLILNFLDLRNKSETVLIMGYMNFLSQWYIKMFAFDGVQIVPMVQPFFCKQFLQLKIKLLNVSIKARNVVVTFVEAVHLEQFSKDVLTDLIPSTFGMLVYKEFTSKETRQELTGTKSAWLIFLRNNVVCWMCDGISLTIG